MTGWIGIALSWLAALIIEPSLPTTPTQDWQFDSKWVAEGGALAFYATSTSIPEQCRKSPESSLVTDNLVQGFHQFWLDGKIIMRTGDPSFRYGSSMNNVAIVPCYILQQGHLLAWKATNLTHYHSEISVWPYLVPKISWWRQVSKHLAAISGCIFLAQTVLVLILFGAQYANRSLLIMYCSAMLCFATHLIFTEPNTFGIMMAPTYLHRLHDAFLWIGLMFMAIVFTRLKVCLKMVCYILVSVNTLAVAIIAMASTLDQAQFGSFIAFIATILFLLTSMITAIFHVMLKDRSLKSFLKMAAISVYALSGICDLLIYLNYVPESVPTYPLGALCAMIFIAILINEDIRTMYHERDYLRQNLELEVKEKTKDLSEKTASLSQAYQELSAIKAESMHNARLASMGTLAAGIAHEINNSLNYVNGGVTPLKNLLLQELSNNPARQKGLKIITLMEEGLNLTFGIIRNLKRQVRSDAGEREDLLVQDEIDSVLLLLKNKINGFVKVNLAIETGMTVTIGRAPFSQILMNLIDNAIDAMEHLNDGEKMISIVGRREGDEKIVRICDCGPGIPPATRDKIFDPFFTTKEVGKGTGLGLHIVYNEMTKIGGKVAVTCPEQGGTTFVLSFPSAGNEALTNSDEKRAVA